MTDGPQGELELAPRARARDPEPSKIAAAGVRAAAAAHRARILAWLEEHPAGGIYTEIALGVHLEPVQVDRRLKQLRLLGAIARLEATRKTPKGYPAHVHVARRYAVAVA